MSAFPPPRGGDQQSSRCQRAWVQKKSCHRFSCSQQPIVSLAPSSGRRGVGSRELQQALAFATAE